MSNLFHPSTIDFSYFQDGLGEVPGIKNSKGNWDLRGHLNRVILIDEQNLGSFALVFDDEGTPASKARLPLIHSVEIVKVLEKFTKQSTHLRNIKNNFYTSRMWAQTENQKDKTIKTDIRFPHNSKELIFSGPHFYVATPLNKTPNENCKSKGDYSDIDITTIPDDYLPRTIFIPACSPDEYIKRLPKWNGTPITQYYRNVHRFLLSQAGERALVNAIIPPETAHLDLVLSISFKNDLDLLKFSGLCSSIVFDFYVKISGKGAMTNEITENLPFPDIPTNHLNYLILRTLRLNCVTNYYAQLWEKNFENSFSNDGWSKEDPHLQSWNKVSHSWTRDVAFRTPFERRQALIEIDILSASALGLSLEELLTIYKIQFPVLQDHEQELRFDQRGMEVPMKTVGGELMVNESHPKFPEMVPPFTPVDREEDYRVAWKFFEEKLLNDSRVKNNA